MKVVLLLTTFLLSKTVLCEDKCIIDFHSHASSEYNISDVASSLKQNRVSQAIYLSRGYSFESQESRKIENDYVSKLSQLTNGVGFCGINLYTVDFKTEAERCLNLDGMYGIKLHPHGNQIGKHYDGVNKEEIIYNDQDMLQNIEQLLRIVNKNSQIIIMHVSKEMTSQMMIDLMKKYPNATLVIAHGAADSLIDLNEIGDFFKNNPHIRRNIYIDTSFFWSYEPLKDSMKKWHRFGRCCQILCVN